MTDTLQRFNDHFLGRLSLFFSISAAGIGFAALIGWVLSIGWLTSFWPGGIPMAPSTALLFVMYGSALPFRTRLLAGYRNPAWAVPVWLGFGLSVALLFLSLCGIRLSVEYLGMDISGMLKGAPIGHMSPMTALLFVMSGSAFLLLSPVRRKRALLSFWMASTVVLAAIILVVGYLVNAPLFYGSSIIPPAMTTSLAFLLLGKALVLTSGFCALPSGRNADDTGEGRNIILILVFILVVAGILGAGHLYSQHQQQQFRSRMETELSTIANLKISQIEQWRRERLGDASMFYKNLAFSQLVQRFFDNPHDAETRQHLQMWLEKIENLPQYFRITLLDKTGTVRVAAPLGFETPVPAASRDIAAGILSHQITFNDFHQESSELPPNLEVVVPILAATDWHDVLGSLVMEIDPGQSLYPLIQTWPTPSPSAEALLVRRDGDDVLFLNDLRFQSNAALKLRFPLTKKNLPAVMAAMGKVGVVEGEDYRQQAVVAAIMAVPETPWFILVKVDRDEIHRPLQERLFSLTGLLCAFLLGAGAIFGLVWRNQRAHFYRLRYEAARELEESAKRLQLIFESVKDGILVAELHTKNIINVNEGMCRMLGYSRTELLTMRLDDIHPEAVSRDIAEKFKLPVRGEVSPAIILPMRCRDGSVFHAEINTTPIQFGGHNCMLGTFRDITDRIADEASIEHLNRVLRAIRNINQLIVRVETVDELIEKACALLVDCRSYTSAIIILIDENDTPIAHVETGEGVDLQPLIEQIEQGRLPSCCGVARSKEGVSLVRGKDALCEPCQLVSDCFSSQRMSIRLEHQKKTYGYLAVSVDLDIAVDIEEERLLIELADDLAYSLYNMEMKRRMRRTEEEKEKIEAQFIQAQKMEAVGRLAGGLAHDFNNLLTIILGYSTILEEKAASDPFFKEPLTEISDAATRATNLTRQLLAFSRKQTLEMYVVDVNQVIEGFAKLLRRSIGEDIQMRLDLATKPALVKADISQLEQVLMNLAINARDAMPDGGLLTIETARIDLDADFAADRRGVPPGSYVMIAMSDNGCGMDKEIRSRIFEPFFTTKARGKGTGLGLSTVYGVVKQHRGNIWVYSEPGLGTTFKVYLPAADEAVTKAEPEAVQEMPISAESHTILVVEDESSLRTLACRILRRKNYKVLESQDPEDAIAIARQHPEPIDLLLTDVIMPVMKGTEVFKKVSEIHPRIRVLYMSGYTENVISHHGMLQKGVSLLKKPFTAGSLVEKVDMTLRN